MYSEVPASDVPTSEVRAPDAPPALAILLVRVAMATDVLSVQRKAGLAGTGLIRRLSPKADDQPAGTRNTGLTSIARRAKRDANLSRWRLNALWEAILVFDCYNRRIDLSSTENDEGESTTHEDQVSARCAHQVETDATPNTTNGWLT